MNNVFLKKILPYVGMLTVVIVVGYFARRNHHTFEKTIVAQVQRQLLNTVRVESRLLNQQALNLTQEVERLSKDVAVRDAFADNFSKTTDQRFYFLEDSYKNIKSLATSLRLLDSRGVMIYKAPSKDDLGKDLVSASDAHPMASGQTVGESGMRTTIDGKKVLIFDQPVFRWEKYVGKLRAVVSLETLHSLLSRHDGDATYSFLLDPEGCLLSYPDEQYLGKNIDILFRDNKLSMSESRFDAVMEKIKRGEEGSGGCRLLIQDRPRKAEEVIVAFSPVFFGTKRLSLVTVIDYATIAEPLNKNVRDNIIFSGLVILVLFLSAFAFYRDERKKNAELQRLYEDLEKNLETLRSTQSLLVQSAKMEVVGTLAAGVAHEVKNPLAIILMGVGYIKRHVSPDNERMAGVIEDVSNAVCRADLIIKGLLDFSLISELDRSAQDINALIDKSLLLVKALFIEKHVHVERNFGVDLPEVSLDSNKIQQVLLNLVMNAIHAMPSGGELRIRTFQERDADQLCWVVVWIEDSGPGIPQRVAKNLFVPFVTTKRTMGGTGLGLSLAKNIIEMHGGKIALENRTDGRGARATLRFRI
jgi:signal transduction histidine kinase